MAILKWLILGLPWVFVPYVNEPFLIPKEAVFVLGCWGFICLTIFRGTPQLSTWTNKPLAWFLLWIVLWGGWLYYGGLIRTRPGATEYVLNFHNWFSTVNVLTGASFLFVLTCYYLPRSDCLIRITQWMCWAAFFVACYTLLQSIQIDQFFIGPDRINSFDTTKPFSSRYMIGTLGNVNYIAMYLAMHLPLYLVFQERKYLMMLAVVLTALVLSEVRFAIVAGILGLLVYVWIRFFQQHRHRLAFGIGAILIGCLSVLTWEYRHLLLIDERFPIWQVLIKEWKLHCLTGIGLGNFVMRFKVHWAQTKLLIPEAVRPGGGWQWAHNDILQSVYELGLIGMIPLLIALWKALLHIWKKSKSSIMSAGWLASGIAMLFLSVANFPWHIAPTALVGLVILAVWNAPELRGGV